MTKKDWSAYTLSDDPYIQEYMEVCMMAEAIEDNIALIRQRGVGAFVVWNSHPKPFWTIGQIRRFMQKPNDPRQWTTVLTVRKVNGRAHSVFIDIPLEYLKLYVQPKPN